MSKGQTGKNDQTASFLEELCRPNILIQWNCWLFGGVYHTFKTEGCRGSSISEGADQSGSPKAPSIKPQFIFLGGGMEAGLPGTEF